MKKLERREIVFPFLLFTLIFLFFILSVQRAQQTATTTTEVKYITILDNPSFVRDSQDENKINVSVTLKYIVVPATTDVTKVLDLIEKGKYKAEAFVEISEIYKLEGKNVTLSFNSTTANKPLCKEETDVNGTIECVADLSDVSGCGYLVAHFEKTEDFNEAYSQVPFCVRREIPFESIFATNEDKAKALLALLFVGLLAAGLYAAGKKPLAAFDITTPKMKGASSYPGFKMTKASGSEILQLAAKRLPYIKRRLSLPSYVSKGIGILRKVGAEQSIINNIERTKNIETKAQMVADALEAYTTPLLKKLNYQEKKISYFNRKLRRATKPEEREKFEGKIEERKKISEDLKKQFKEIDELIIFLKNLVGPDVEKINSKDYKRLKKEEFSEIFDTLFKNLGKEKKIDISAEFIGKSSIDLDSLKQIRDLYNAFWRVEGSLLLMKKSLLSMKEAGKINKGFKEKLNFINKKLEIIKTARHKFEEKEKEFLKLLRFQEVNEEIEKLEGQPMIAKNKEKLEKLKKERDDLVGGEFRGESAPYLKAKLFAEYGMLLKEAKGKLNDLEKEFPISNYNITLDGNDAKYLAAEIIKSDKEMREIGIHRLVDWLSQEYPRNEEQLKLLAKELSKEPKIKEELIKELEEKASEFEEKTIYEERLKNMKEIAEKEKVKIFAAEITEGLGAKLDAFRAKQIKNRLSSLAKELRE